MKRLAARTAKKPEIVADQNTPPLTLEDLKQARLFIATPMYGGQCTGFFAQSMLRLQQVMGQVGVVTSISFMFNESLITRARNALTAGFLKSDCTHLMFIDADIRFNAEEVPLMMQWDKDVICGIYAKKEINWQGVLDAHSRGVPLCELNKYTGSFVVNLVGYTNTVTVPIAQPCEIWNGGTGFMLIKRSVFEKMAAVVPTYVNDVLDLAGTIKADPIQEFFTTSIEPGTNRLLSEDYHFCRAWREMGGKIYAAPWARLAHVGSYVFEGGLIPSP